MRSLYTGQIRPIFMWGVELFHREGPQPAYRDMESIEYRALTKTAGAYQGSWHKKLGLIANVEPLQPKLQDIATSWKARCLRTGDQKIRNFLDAPLHRLTPLGITEKIGKPRKTPPSL